MSSYALIGGTIVVGLALIIDVPQTVQLGTSILTIAGVTFLAKKITQSMENDYSGFIAMAGICLMAIPAIGLLKLSMSGIGHMKEDIVIIAQFMDTFVDKLNPITWFTPKS